MTSHLRLHARQFLIWRNQESPLPHWATADLGEGWFLHRDPNIEAIEHGSNVLLGLAAESVEGRSRPDEILAKRDLEPDDFFSWAGRWLLIHNRQVHTDASALLGCYHGRLPKAGFVATSSLAVAALVNGETTEPAAPPQVGLDWLPPHVSPLPPLKRLLPSQTLRLRQEDGQVAYEKDGLFRTYSEGTAPEGFAQALLGALSQRPGRFLLPLTGGLDSRTVLAAAAASKRHFVTFTHVAAGVPYGDREIPKRLSSAVGAPHVRLTDGRRSASAVELFDQHAFRQAHQNRSFVEHDHYRSLPQGEWTSLSGNCFEVGRCHYWSRLPATTGGGASGTAADILHRFFRGNSPSPPNLLHEGLQAWLAELEERDLGGVDWRDMFYIEQRLAAWLSTTTQAMDVLDRPAHYICNSHHAYSLMLSMPPGDRKAGKIQLEAIRLLAPQLLRIPINPPAPLHRRLRQRVARIFRSRVGSRAS